MTEVSGEHTAVGEFFRRDTSLMAMLGAAATIILLSFLLWFTGVHVLVTVLVLLTGLMGMVPFGVYIYRRFSVRMEVHKRDDQTFDVIVKTYRTTISNPPSVYFGFDHTASGHYIMKMGIPAPQGLLVLAETLPRHLSMENIEKFYVPPTLETFLEYTSVRSYPGDLTDLVSLLGFVDSDF